MLRITLLFGLTAALATAQVGKPLKWACIGNSITQGMGANTPYPARLGSKLGAAFTVQNDGVSGTTLLKRGDMPYWTQGKLSEVFAFKPDIITIKLGTNDTKTQNWQYQGDFVKDLTALVDTLSGGIPTHPAIFLCLPCPIFPNSYGIRDSVLANSLNARIRQVAAAKGLEVIDIYDPLKPYPQLFPDGVHPNDAGADSIASIIYRAYLTTVQRVACIGNSITQYVGTVPGAAAVDAYAMQLNMLLGRGYYTQNDGVSGAFMQKKSSMPYWTRGKLPAVFALKPQIITLALGTNDARSTEWHTDAFLADTRAMIDTLSNTISPKPKIWVCLPMPSWRVNGQWAFDNGVAGNGISDDLIRDSVIPALKKVAAEKNLPTIDLYAPMQPWRAYVSDGVHPNAKGQDTLAQAIYRALTSLPPLALYPRPSRAPGERGGAGIPAAGFPSPLQSHTLDGRAIREPSFSRASVRKPGASSRRPIR